MSGLNRVYRTGSKRRPAEVTALRGLDLRIAPGEVHGLLGPNGAGKTTLCKILSTILLPSAGTATIFGHDVVQDADVVRRLIGLVLGGDKGLYGKLNAVQNLKFWAAMYGIGRKETATVIQEIVERVGLEDAVGPVDRFSRGMKQRLHLARGLMPAPRVLLLDEPTIGMDPVSAVAFRSLIEDVRASGTTVLITTHDMAEAEAVCDRVSLIDKGALIATETPAGLGQLISRFERLDVHSLTDTEAAELRIRYLADPSIASATVLPGGQLRIETKAAGTLAPLINDLVQRGHTSIQVGTPSLGEVYVHLIGDRGMKL
ncbi:ABC transporter ATP-binding protein [Arthrobacter tumbae]|uniref:ABC transporter ATP-binding protein n=1 Tax=Arthrobacter tumbae TaxID=163874 RepID=UPI00195915E3|nr:ABC transporter ATP-binding protein [Arthrobacter tumbae]MBM7781864.1 ABC-2 type transport system ATP-binding protein [Arthrobacter tumbae]